jgi:prepilin-type N-terminal cleavage/methylation domain-containing protein
MTVPSSQEGEAGFTLIEMIIALLIMAIAVVTIAGGLAAMLELTGQHRGHAVTEVAARSFSEVAQEQAHATTVLTANLAKDAGDTTLAVVSTALLPRVDGTNSYVLVGREVMRVSSMPTATSIVVNRVHNAGTLEAHDAGDAVTPVLRCPTAAQLTPDDGTYEAVEGVDITISAVEYWDSVQKKFLTDRDACIGGTHTATVDSDGFDETCADPDSPATLVLPECGWGYYRATVEVTTPDDGRLKEIQTSTSVLLRAANG